MGNSLNTFRRTRKREIADTLPTEILHRIFTFLDPVSLFKCELTCRFWHNLILRGHAADLLEKTTLSHACILPSNSNGLKFFPQNTTGIKNKFLNLDKKTSPTLYLRYSIGAIVFQDLNSEHIKLFSAILAKNLPIGVTEVHFYGCNFEDVKEEEMELFLLQLSSHSAMEKLVVEDCSKISSAFTGSSIAKQAFNLNRLVLNCSQETLTFSADFFIALDFGKLRQLKMGKCDGVNDEMVASIMGIWMGMERRMNLDLDFYDCSLDPNTIIDLCPQLPLIKRPKFLDLTNQENVLSFFASD